MLQSGSDLSSGRTSVTPLASATGSLRTTRNGELAAGFVNVGRLRLSATSGQVEVVAQGARSFSTPGSGLSSQMKNPVFASWKPAARIFRPVVVNWNVSPVQPAPVGAERGFPAPFWMVPALTLMPYLWLG